MSKTGHTIEEVVFRADMFFHRPVTKAWDELPVANGQMGTLVWTRKTCIELQHYRAMASRSRSSA